VVGSLFLLWRQRLKFLAKLSLFFKNNSPRFTLIFGECVASYGEISVNLCGDRHLASVATVQKWPNKKKTKKKKTGDGWDSQLIFFPPPPLVWCLLE